MKGNSLDGSWVAIQVRTKMELAVADQLVLRGYESFAPMYRRRSDGGKGARNEALFPGYVFCRYRSTYEFRIVDTPWVIRLLETAGTPQTVDEQELEAVRRILRFGVQPEAWKTAVIGQLVRVRYGPLSGLRGTLVEIRNGARLLIGVSSIRKYVAVEVGAEDVLPI